MENLDRIGPVIILLVTAGLVVLADLIWRRERVRLITAVALIGLVLAALDTVWLIARDMRGFAFQETVVLDRFTLFFNFFFDFFLYFFVLFLFFNLFVLFLLFFAAAMRIGGSH